MDSSVSWEERNFITNWATIALSRTYFILHNHLSVSSRRVCSWYYVLGNFKEQNLRWETVAQLGKYIIRNFLKPRPETDCRDIWSCNISGWRKMGRYVCHYLRTDGNVLRTWRHCPCSLNVILMTDIGQHFRYIIYAIYVVEFTDVDRIIRDQHMWLKEKPLSITGPRILVI
jgi:hypothetical protein